MGTELEKAYDLGVEHGKRGNINELVTLIEQWGEPKGLTEQRPMLKSWPQFEKVQEEVTEIARAIVNNDKAGLADAIGDTFVTINLLAKQNGLEIADCISLAYNEIKNRTGKTVDGKFIKDVKKGFKIGDIATVLRNRDLHDFSIGEDVRLLSVPSDLNDDIRYWDCEDIDNGHRIYYVREEDLQLK